MVESPLPMPAPLGWPASTVVLLTVVYLVVVSPIRGARSYRRLRASLVADPTALAGFNRRTVVRKLAWLVPIVLVLVLAPGLTPRHLGLAWPSGPAVVPMAWILLSAALAVVASVALWGRRIREGRSVPGLAAMRPLAPRTARQWRWAIATHASAGVIEELMLRGLLLAAGLSLGLPPLLVLLATSVMFGLLHLYQGWFGVVTTALLGAGLTLSVLLTGSLLFAVILHLLLGMRALVVLALIPAVAPGPGPPRPASG